MIPTPHLEIKKKAASCTTTVESLHNSYLGDREKWSNAERFKQESMYTMDCKSSSCNMVFKTHIILLIKKY